MKPLILCLTLMCLEAQAQEMRVKNAMPLDYPTGPSCAVVLSEYYAGSVVMYTGNCGWQGLKGVGGYIQAWNHSNHIKIVRGLFDSGRAVSWAKVTYINRVKNSVETYEEDEEPWMTKNRKSYMLDEIETDARQAGLVLNFNRASSLIRLANYLDVLE